MSENTAVVASAVADTIMRTVELGVTIRDAAIDGHTTVVFCDLITTAEDRCPACGGVGKFRDRIERRVTDVPVAGHPLQLRVRVPRYRCTDTACGREVFCHNTDRLARAGWSTTAVVAADTSRFDNVRVIGVDEHR